MFKKKPIGNFIDRLKEKKANKKDGFDNGTVRIKWDVNSNSNNNSDIGTISESSTSKPKSNLGQKRIFHHYRSRENRAGSENFLRIREHLLAKRKFTLAKKKSHSSEHINSECKTNNGQQHSKQSSKAFHFFRNNNKSVVGAAQQTTAATNENSNKRASVRVMMMRSTPANINSSALEDESSDDDELFLDETSSGDLEGERDDLMDNDEDEDEEKDVEEQIWREIYLLDKTLEEYS